MENKDKVDQKAGGSGAGAEGGRGVECSGACGGPALPDHGIRTYVLRAGRMTELQRRSLEELTPRYCIPFEGKKLNFDIAFGRHHGGLVPGLPHCGAGKGQTPGQASAAAGAAGSVSAHAAAAGAQEGGQVPLVAEIGFGMGTATWQIAAAFPDVDFLGIEVHTPGVGKLMSLLKEHSVGNVRIVHHDAVELFEQGIEPGTLAGINIFYPDPWPKKRHHKRRLIRPDLVDILVPRLAPGGYLYFVTDIEDYAESSLEVLNAAKGLKNCFDGFAPRQLWRPETKFEARALRDGRGAWELFFVRQD